MPGLQGGLGNWGLHRKQDVYQHTGKNIDAVALHRELNQLKQTDIPWMYDVSKTAPQEALLNLDTTFDQFFQRVKRPKRKGTAWRC
jgi:putative transposase